MIHMLVRPSVRMHLRPAQRATLRRRLQRALSATGWGSAQVSLTLSDNDELHALNQQYADEDHATDVLSFAQLEAPAKSPPPKGLPLLLGDIVISVPIAAQQAQTQGHTLDAELLHLAVHGLCHLLGYDHATSAEERVMFGYEARLRNEATARRATRPCPPPPMPGRARSARSTRSTASAGR
ncbi:MAG: rRNA maturation RNase YbeY [Myxococcales bacterium]|nr:rRNA maturation RNase YbeY [Myxococcales bacterium]